MNIITLTDSFLIISLIAICCCIVASACVWVSKFSFQGQNTIIAITSVLLALGLLSCQQEDFTSSGRADDHFFLQNAGQSMPVRVAGNVDARKFIVIIHGGPGGEGIVYQDDYVREYVEDKFAMVYWDQRFAGNTQGHGGNSDISAFREDIKKLLQLLKSKYGTDIKFYLLGHSWGGFLAPYFLSEAGNQQLVNGWIQVGGAHNYRMNDSLTREMLLHYGRIELQAQNNVTDWEEIVDWCTANGFEGSENAGTLNGFAHRAETLIAEVQQPDYEDWEVFLNRSFFATLVNEMASAIREIDAPTYETPISDRLPGITLPTLLLWGKYDFVCPPGLSEDIERRIGSRNVRKVVFPRSGHSPMANEPKAFWDVVVDWVQRH